MICKLFLQQPDVFNGGFIYINTSLNHLISYFVLSKTMLGAFICHNRIQEQQHILIDAPREPLCKCNIEKFYFQKLKLRYTISG